VIAILSYAYRSGVVPWAIRSTVLQEALYIVVIAQELKKQGVLRVLKDETQLEAHPDFVPVIAQFPSPPRAFRSAAGIARIAFSRSGWMRTGFKRRFQDRIPL
jgi:hypothetical protein